MKILQVMIWMLRISLFYPLLFFRGIFMLISQYLVGLGLLAFLVVLFVGNVPWQLKCSIFSFSFVMFLLRHFYDMLLLKINPTGLELTLQQ